MKKILVLLMLVLLIPAVQPAFAQNSAKKIWTGVVVDSKGEPLPGVAVFVTGAVSGGSITNDNGSFSIQAAPDDEIQFACLGYENQTLKASSAQLKRVVLKDEAEVLQTAVVTALGIKRDEKSIGYSAQKVEGDMFVSSATTGNWLNGMSGQVAGLNIDRSSSPDGSMRVTVRGESSADLENNTALFVVDGVPMYNSATASNSGEGSIYAIDYGNGLSDIDPNNIENVTVLKGAAATALYGSQAANGAIIITTKNAESQDAVFSVNFKSSFAADRVISSPDLQYTYGQGSAGLDYYYYMVSGEGEAVAGLNPRPDYVSTANMESWGPKMDGTPYYQYYNEQKGIGGTINQYGDFVRTETPFISYGNWFQDYFETGLTFSNSLVMSGKIGKDNSVRVSFTNNSGSGIVPNSPSMTNFLAVRTTSRLAKWLKMETSINYRNTRKDNIPVSSGYGSTAIMYSLWCYAPNVDMSWAKNYWKDEKNSLQDASLTGGKNNAYFLAYQGISNQKRDRVYGNVVFNADLAKGLTLMVRGGLDIIGDFRTQRVPTSAQTNPKGSYNEQTINTKQYTGDFLLKYNTRFGSDFEFTGNLGGSILWRSSSTHTQNASTLNIPGVYSLINTAYEPKTSNSSYVRQTNSLYGLLSLSWKNAIFLDVTGRNDWSSTLPASNRSFFYPSVSGSISLNDLFEFGRTNGLVNLMKIRASWAQVGNDTAPYRVSNYLQGTGFPGTVAIPSTRVNTNLRPEIVSSWEVGLELRMFKNRFTLDAAYYDAVTKDLISRMPVSYANGVNYMYVNAGSIRNRGVELSATGTLVKTRDLQWKVGLNYTMNRNTVVSLGEGIDSWIIASYSTHAYMIAYEGGSLTSMYGKGYVRAPEGSTAISADGKMVDVSGLPVLDSQNLYQTGTDLQYLGECAPDWKGGFNTTLKWKDLSFYIGFDGQMGGHVYSYTNWVLNYRGKGIATVDGREGGLVPVGVRVTPDGNYVVNTSAIDAADISTYYHNKYEQTNGEANFVSTQFLKLREVRFEYSLPRKLLAKTKVLSGASISAYANNVWCWSEFPGFDPEGVTMRGSAVIPGFEILQMPSSAQFGASISLTF
ncbi:MAG: SusC/RagA family TonB-linked outer membrane protein [Bacteroidales bacterium]|nr:SusC/RagA family TonB-linked outer membrane protein [Bacteroidales bacterium]